MRCHNRYWTLTQREHFHKDKLQFAGVTPYHTVFVWWWCISSHASNWFFFCLAKHHVCKVHFHRLLCYPFVPFFKGIISGGCINSYCYPPNLSTISKWETGNQSQFRSIFTRIMRGVEGHREGSNLKSHQEYFKETCLPSSQLCSWFLRGTWADGWVLPLPWSQAEGHLLNHRATASAVEAEESATASQWTGVINSLQITFPHKPSKSGVR